MQGGWKMAEEKRRYKTTIAERPYTIVAKKPEEHLKVVSEIANEKIDQLKDVMPNLDVEQRAVLIAVNAISESMERQAELDELKEKLASLEKELKKRPITSPNPVPDKSAKTAKTAKAAKSRFVRPTTAAENRLKQAQQLETNQEKEGQQPSRNR
jgi:cell division protein ZapA